MRLGFGAVAILPPMFVMDIFFALVVASLLTMLFYLGRSGRAGRWATIASVLIGLVFALWLSGVWLSPAAPVIWVTHWFSYAFVVLLVALLAFILIPRRVAPPSASPGAQKDMLGVTLFFSLSALFFVTLIVLRFV